MATTSKKLTLEHFLKLREKEPALEFEEGRMRQKVSPKGEHSVVQVALVNSVRWFYRAAPPGTRLFGAEDHLRRPLLRPRCVGVYLG